MLTGQYNFLTAMKLSLVMALVTIVIPKLYTSYSGLNRHLPFGFLSSLFFFFSP